MRVLRGEVTHGFGAAAGNLAHVARVIAVRTGLPRLTPGTLNVRLPEPYLVAADATVGSVEYDGYEFLKLQRCVVQGVRAVIVRPHKHETVPGWGHGTSHIEIVSAVHFRSTLGLLDGTALSIEVGGGPAWWARARGGEVQILKARVRHYVQRTLQLSA